MDRCLMMLALLSLLAYIQQYCFVTGFPRRHSREPSTCSDIVPEHCRDDLQHNYCYQPFNRALCCVTCERIRRQYNDPECPYGDRNTIIQEHGQIWTCSSYLETYGYWRCTRDYSFRHHCCQSCNYTANS